MIKKVAIPEIEVKYICESIEEEYENIRIKCAEDTKRFFKRIETEKPLKDNEITYKDMADCNIYACVKDESIWIVKEIKRSGTNIKHYYLVPITTKQNSCANGETLEECCRICVIHAHKPFGGEQKDLYEFSGTDKYKEFAKWSLQQLTDEQYMSYKEVDKIVEDIKEDKKPMKMGNLNRKY